jgi:TRAP-type mannitol/chloroaromatic compound transport system substrate-binding protein
MGGWFRREIRSLDDMRGLKFRIGGFAGRILQKLGVVPQQLAAGDIYPALEKGTIDSAEWVGPYDDEKLGLVRVAKYYYYPGWWEGGATPHLLVNLTKWNELPKIYQALVQTCAREAGVWMTGKYDTLNPQAIKRLVAQGAELRPFPQPVMEASYSAANDLYAEIARNNPLFKRLLDSLSAFRSDSYQWMQVAELSYDSFMMRMRTRT